VGGYYDSYGKLWGVGTYEEGQARLVVNTTNCRITRIGVCNERLGGGSGTRLTGTAYPVSQAMSFDTGWINYQSCPRTADNSNIYSTTNSTNVDIYLAGQGKQNRINTVTISGTGINPFAIGSNC
jgi:hypothetical protein